MKQFLGALAGVLVIALSGAGADAQAYYRDHAGWAGAQAAPMVAARATGAAATAAKPKAHATARRAWRRTWHRSTWSRYYRPVSYHPSSQAYRRVWFGNKLVWWPVGGNGAVAAARPASYHWTAPRRAARRGHRVTWHPGYWTSAPNGGPGTWTPEPVYRYNPNGSQPQIMNAPRPTKTAKRGASKTYAGYQYYYYGQPTSAKPGTPVASANRTVRRSAAMSAPTAMSAHKDNIPTVYLYQRGHAQGIHLPEAQAPKEETKPAAAAGVAPGQAIAPGAPLVPPGGLAPGQPLIPGAAPAAPAVPAAPQVPSGRP